MHRRYSKHQHRHPKRSRKVSCCIRQNTRLASVDGNSKTKKSGMSLQTRQPIDNFDELQRLAKNTFKTAVESLCVSKSLTSKEINCSNSPWKSHN